MASSGVWRTVTRREPCPVCGRGDWCAVSTDGAAAICRREGTPGEDRTDAQGVRFWLHWLHGRPLGRSTNTGGPGPRDVPVASADDRDTVYRAWLAALELSGAHRAALRGRGLDDEAIDRASFRSLPGRGRAALARRLVEDHGETRCRGVPGITWRENRGGWTLAGWSGLLIPIRDVAGRIIALGCRPDASDDGDRTPPKYCLISSASDGGPSPGAPIHVARPPDPAAGVVRVTEGWLKASVAAALSGVSTLGLSGVTWRAAPAVIAEIEAAAGVPIEARLAFDSDAHTNDLVGAATLSLAAAYRKATGRTMAVERWEEEKGVDDALAAGRAIDVLRDGAAREWLRALQQRHAWKVPEVPAEEKKGRADPLGGLEIVSIAQRRDCGTETRYAMRLRYQGVEGTIRDLRAGDIRSYPRVATIACDADPAPGLCLPAVTRGAAARWNELLAAAWQGAAISSASAEDTQAMEIRELIQGWVGRLCREWNPEEEPEPRGMRFFPYTEGRVAIARGVVWDMLRERMGAVSRVAFRRATESLGWVWEGDRMSVGRGFRFHVWSVDRASFDATKEAFGEPVAAAHEPSSPNGDATVVGLEDPF